MHNAITWFEIPAVDFERTINFYETLLGIPLRRMDFMGTPHGIFPSDENGVGGAVVLNPNYQTSDTGTVIYLNTGSDLDGVLSRLEAAGGTLKMPKTNIGPQGTIAIIVDTEGNQVGLHQPPM